MSGYVGSGRSGRGVDGIPHADKPTRRGVGVLGQPSPLLTICSPMDL